ncbi:MAG: hypothetical protein ABL907_04795 [Hyphomicrobium sp.]
MNVKVRKCSKAGLAAILAAVSIGAAGAALAHEHGDGHKCPKGTIMTDDHTCVKAPK